MTKYLNGQKINEMIVFSNNDDHTIGVYVSLDPLQEGERKVRISQTEITRYLQDAGYDIDACVKGAVITNTSDKLFGEWVYTLKVDPKEVIATPAVAQHCPKCGKEIEYGGSCQDHEKEKKVKKKKGTNDQQ